MNIDAENTPNTEMCNSNGMSGDRNSHPSMNGNNNDNEERKGPQQTTIKDENDNDGDVVMKDASANATPIMKSKDINKTVTITDSSSSSTTSASVNRTGTNNNTMAKSTTATASEKETTVAPVAASSNPPPPVLRGTLSYNAEPRQHLIRGMWNYENSNTFPPQKFELLRNLMDDETDVKVLPKDGEFHGSFCLVYYHTTSKGKQKERSKVVPESCVKIKFTKIQNTNANANDDDDKYKVDGTGVNQFGIFHINGTAKPTPHNDGQYSIELRKRYDSSATATTPTTTITPKKIKKSKKNTKKNNNSLSSSSSANNKSKSDPTELPPPSESYEKDIVCLRGKLAKEGNNEDAFNDPHQLLGNENVVHKISGVWSSGLDLLLSDPDNIRGLCNRFEYEHKSSSPNASFPVSGRYSGWFDLNGEEGGKTKIAEKDITLRFRRNNAGYHNVEGKGSNAFGKYTITGTLTKDNVVTIFRHFLQKKAKSSSSRSGSSKLSVTSAPPPINAPDQTRKISPQRQDTAPANKLTLDDVVIPNDNNNDGGEQGPEEPLQPPDHPTYSAVSRGVLRVNEDGSHSCQGKWAMTREHFTNGQTSNFNFRLESHHSEEAMKKNDGVNGARPFPLDSDTYKGSFQLKKGGSRYSTIVDTQVVMKFRKNTAGTYNVHGNGINEIGVFDLTGTLIASGKTGGQVELYRIYRPELLAQQPMKSPKDSKSKEPGGTDSGLPAGSNLPPMSAKHINNMASGSYSTMLPGPPRAAAVGIALTAVGSGVGLTMSRRESTRLVKVPSRLEDEDPGAQFSRIMDKCIVLLRIIREKDVEMGAFFSEPVDPVALGIPTYPQVIKEPMDLRTLHLKMEANEVKSPEEFARLCRLVFENAVMFNVDPTNSVHQAARNLLILFNQKHRDIERQIANLRRDGGGIPDDTKGKKGDKKRKRGGKNEIEEEIKSMKRSRLDEAHEMAMANSQAMTSLIGAAPPPSTTDAGVTRKEFNIMLSMIQKLQHQVVQTYTAIAELSSDELEYGRDSGGRSTTSGGKGYDVLASTAGAPSATKSTSAGKKKSKKKVDLPKKENVKKKEQQQKLQKQQQHQPDIVDDDDVPLTLQEQELLTETIPNLAPDNLHGVIQIIREAAKLTGDEDEIDLEIDQLDTVTQRKLLRYVNKFNKPKGKKPKAIKKTKAPTASQAKKKSSQTDQKSPVAAAVENPKSNSFFSFGNEENSDSESEGEIEEEPAVEPVAATSPPSAQDESKDFQLGGLGDDDDDEEEEGEDNDHDMGGATSWNISKLEEETEKKDGDVDDAWGAAREKAVAAKAREEDKKKREEKLKAEAEQQKIENLAEAVAHGEEIKAQRQAEEEEEARLQEESERKAEEERKKAREDARKQVQSVEQTVDFDAERDLMKQLEQSYMDKEMGGASPSSDFGF